MVTTLISIYFIAPFFICFHCQNKRPENVIAILYTEQWGYKTTSLPKINSISSSIAALIVVNVWKNGGHDMK